MFEFGCGTGRLGMLGPERLGQLCVLAGGDDPGDDLRLRAERPVYRAPLGDFEQPGALFGVERPLEHDGPAGSRS